MQTNVILIADSGSTKTDWCVIDQGNVTLEISTQGINPFHQSKETISTILSKELLPQLGENAPQELHFYGSGCTTANAVVMQEILSAALPSPCQVSVYNDLLGAARALCGTSSGIACILGTGVNSCLYDGVKITKNVPPLGYILGDEGSGAVLGKHFLNAVYKGFLPPAIRKQLEEYLSMNYQQIISRVYREPMANRFLASLAPFIHSNLHIPVIRGIVVSNFREFFRRNVIHYGSNSLPIGAVGGIAFFFNDELREAARLEGCSISKILRSPMQGLVEFHS